MVFPVKCRSSLKCSVLLSLVMPENDSMLSVYDEVNALFSFVEN